MPPTWNEFLPFALESAAERAPDAEAVRFGEQSLSYGELLVEVNRTANLLRSLGVRRGDRVGISLHKGVEGLVAMWAVMQAGGAYVPIDPALPTERVALLINDCDIRILFSANRGRANLAAVAARAPGLRTAIGLEAADGSSLECVSPKDLGGYHETGKPDIKVIGDDLGYIIYTSGSTGQPKGIMHSHRSGTIYARYTCDYYGLRPTDRIGNHAPMHFDISTFDYFAAAAAGATVVPISEEAMMMPAAYTDVLARDRISVLFVVPLVLTQMVLHGVVEKRDLRALRWIIFGGDIVPIKHLRALATELPHTAFSNMYGPAETNGCIGFRLHGAPDEQEGLPIGTPFENMDVKVVDQEGESVGTGETGEIIVRGPTVMLGYWRKEEMTAERLVEPQVIPGIRDVYYRTGDLALLREDGNLVFAGRSDRLIKTRGYRVELDEVELALLAHPAVQEGAAFAVTYQETDRVVRAAVVLNDNHETSEAELRRFLSEKLSSYAIPERIEIMPALPKTTSGKIDRRSLADRSEESDS